MQLILFLVVAVALYFLCDLALRGLERAAGRRFESRSLIFFGLLLGSALITFSAVRGFLAG